MGGYFIDDLIDLLPVLWAAVRREPHPRIRWGRIALALLALVACFAVLALVVIGALDLLGVRS